MKMDLPEVLDCEVSLCVYNHEKTCHAGAINVGDQKPLCDTFLRGELKAGFNSNSAQIGACKFIVCRFNKKFECSSEGIHVKLDDNLAVCGSYHSRP